MKILARIIVYILLSPIWIVAGISLSPYIIYKWAFNDVDSYANSDTLWGAFCYYLGIDDFTNKVGQ